MKDQEFKDLWKSLEEDMGMPISGGAFDTQKFINSRSSTVKKRIQKNLHIDLSLKLVSFAILFLNIAFYHETINVLYVCFAGLVFLSIMSFIEYKTLHQFNRISDPGTNTRDNLSEALIFLQRKSTLIGIVTASTQVFIFIPGLLTYYFLVYGHLKPISGEIFFVFSTLCFIGIVMSYITNTSQIKYHIKHLTICVSDLNDSVLQMAYSTIEKDRKRDGTMKILTALLLIFGSILFLAVLKSIMG